MKQKQLLYNCQYCIQASRASS